MDVLRLTHLLFPELDDLRRNEVVHVRQFPYSIPVLADD